MKSIKVLTLLAFVSFNLSAMNQQELVRLALLDHIFRMPAQRDASRQTFEDSAAAKAFKDKSSYKLRHNGGRKPLRTKYSQQPRRSRR